MKKSLSLHQNDSTPDQPASENIISIPRPFDKQTIRPVMRIAVEPRPLERLQKLSLDSVPAICVCNDFREAQRYFCEIVSDARTGEAQTFLVHEMMPQFQQDYVLRTIAELRDCSPGLAVTLFTTRGFFTKVNLRLPWLLESCEIVPVSLTDYAIAENPDEDIIDGRAMAAQLNDEMEQGDESRDIRDEAAVSCICLRKGFGGRWLLMDHDEAITVSPKTLPDDRMIARLLRHSVKISGDELAPYLTMEFDVPTAWKANQDLAARALLLFENDICTMECRKKGIPTRIFWSDRLGIVYEK